MLCSLLEFSLPHSYSGTFSSHSSRLKTALQRVFLLKPSPETTQMRASAIQSQKVLPFPFGELTTVCTYKYERQSFPQAVRLLGRERCLVLIPSTLHIVGAQ